MVHPFLEDLDQNGKIFIFVDRSKRNYFRGNYGYDSGGECAVPMVHRFHSPSNGNGLFWYSFDVGPTHILIFSTEHDFQQSSVQYNWIEHDLQSVNRTRTPWIIIGSHRPMYTSEIDYPDLLVSAHLQVHLEHYSINIRLTLIYLHICMLMKDHVQCINKNVFMME